MLFEIQMLRRWKQVLYFQGKNEAGRSVTSFVYCCLLHSRDLYNAHDWFSFQKKYFLKFFYTKMQVLIPYMKCFNFTLIRLSAIYFVTSFFLLTMWYSRRRLISNSNASPEIISNKPSTKKYIRSNLDGKHEIYM